MMIYERPVHDVIVPSPGSPPGMTASKSSKSSSFHSLSSDDNSVLADASHFEEIGLEDDTLHFEHGTADIKSPTPNRFSPSYPSDLRAASAKHVSQRLPSSRDLASKSRPQPQPQPQRDITAAPRKRPAYPGLQSHVRNINVRSTSTHALVPDPLPMRSLGPRSSSTLSFRRRRSPSPNLSLSPRDPNLVTKPRRSSWQSNRERKSAFQLEQECDEDEGDDIPEGLILDNVPISPRPASERTFSQPSSKAASPERTPKEKVRSVGNGTPAVATAQGSLRSPSWKSDSAASSAKSPTSTDGIPQLKSRAKSWTAALSELNAEAKALTEKLEEHADEIDHKSQRSSTGSMPAVRRSNTDSYESKPRHKSALAELPPLRRTNIMIDPLPISKEKEAVLSRTRPSWLPPKDPAEERRHLKEYQKMMAHSAEADRRREAAKRAKSECRDTAADSLMQIWEHDIVPRWNDAIRERRTRELWWQGIAPRSRGLVWTRAIGNDLGLTEASYNAALGRAQEAKTRVSAGNGSEDDMAHNSWFETIGKDAEENTWKDLKIFQKGGPLHQGLIDVLSAYAMYRSDIGYVSGCNTIAALLLLNLTSPAAAFISLANLLNRPLPLSFYASDAGAKASAYNLLLQTLSHKSTELHDHLVKLPEHDADLYLGDIFTSLLTGHLALDEATRLWDVYVFEGDAVLVRAGVAFLLRKEMHLLGTKSIEEVRAVLVDSSSKQEESTQRVVTRQGEEDRWMRAVREAGKA